MRLRTGVSIAACSALAAGAVVLAVGPGTDGSGAPCDPTVRYQPSPGSATLADFRDASRGLPPDKSAAFNEYTDRFEVVDSVAVRAGGLSTAGEPVVYDCDGPEPPRLVPLSAVDPGAGAATRQGARRTLQEIAGGELTGLGRSGSGR